MQSNQQVYHKSEHRPTALVLPGGGARAAYQVGVLKAFTELFAKHNPNPFSIISGTSAGAINAAALAASAHNFRLAVLKVEKIWRNLAVHQVYKSGYRDLLGSVLRLLASLFNDGMSNQRPLAMLDTAPLQRLLQQVIDFEAINTRIAKGDLHALGVTASNYSTGESVTFYQSHSALAPWRSARRVGVPDRISVQHLLASSAIPTILPAAKIGPHYYGDGALRQVAPISAALHMGAERVVVIGVSGNRSQPAQTQAEGHPPSLARMVGHVFNSAFIDALDSDIEHLSRINELVGIIHNENPRAPTANLDQVDLLCINPTFEIDKVAADYICNLPPAMRTAFRITGSTPAGGGSSMASYLLFDGKFCRDLIQHGYRDACAKRDIIEHFFYPPAPGSHF